MNLASDLYRGTVIKLREIEMPPSPKLDVQELERRAAYYAPTDSMERLIGRNRQYYLDYATFIFKSIPESREASVAQTNLEQVLFWVNAAIARNHDKL